MEITRKVSCMPRMFCMKKDVSGKVEEYILVYTTNTDCEYRVDNVLLGKKPKSIWRSRHWKK